MDQPMDSLLAASPFLTDTQDFSPSPRSSRFEISPHLPPYDSFDTPHFPHTPSYNGSYQNSPYSVTSELPPIDDDLAYLSQHVVHFDDVYDPNDFDAPNVGLLSFDETQFIPGLDQHNPQVSVSITPPAEYESKSLSNAFDHSSPGSSNGEEDHISRASSTSSYMQAHSPRMDLAHNFEGFGFDSPSWATGPLPNDRASPPSHKPQSPPQLVIPDAGSPSATGMESPPIINAPDGDGIMSGPQLHIVPATPVSGGGGTTQPVPFQQTLVALQSGASQNVQQSGPSSWDHHQQHLTSSQSQGIRASQYNDHAFVYPGSNQEQDSSAISFEAHDSQIGHSHNESHQQFLLPQQQQRSRSLSDTSLRPPIWGTAPGMPSIHQGTSAGVDVSRMSHDARSSGTTVNLNDVLPGPSSNPLQSRPTSRHPNSASPHQSSFGGPMHPGMSNSYNSFGPPSSNQMSGMPNYLTPNVSAVDLRRVKSDRTHTHTRAVRSEDYRHSTGLLIPPMSSTQQEYMSRQYLHPTELVPSITRGHHRRSSSGSRERLANMGPSWGTPGSSARASPYPSPSASPRPGPGMLPEPSMSMMGPPRGGVVQVDMGAGVPAESITLRVSKRNVTTPSTSEASQKRRTQPANFSCPVPGCGSTFTRHFNLKGHLRSHAEEKPYQCKWPGCGKGFARQHDCRRHEQLHLNIRPYPCEGCKKNFARMDALNRHLRSEGGAECRKIQEEVTTSGTENEIPNQSGLGLNMKAEPEEWKNSNGLIM